MYKNVTPFPMDFLHTPQHAVDGAMTSLSLAGIYCARTLLGRHVCKRVDVCHENIIVYLANICTLWAPSSYFHVTVRYRL